MEYYGGKQRSDCIFSKRRRQIQHSNGTNSGQSNSDSGLQNGAETVGEADVYCGKDKIHPVRETVAQSKNKVDFAYMQSSSEYYEVLYPLTIKGNALENFVRMQKLDMDKIIAVGDNENDVDMVKKVRFGFMTLDAENSTKKRQTLFAAVARKISLRVWYEKWKKYVVKMHKNEHEKKIYLAHRYKIYF